MKRKGLICGLISCMLAFFTMAVATAKVEASADASTVYPFETGVNAFEYGAEVTAVADDWTKVYYKPYDALYGINEFQGIQAGGVLALQVSTEKTVAIYMTAYNGVAEVGYAWGSAWFMYENGTIINVRGMGANMILDIAFENLGIKQLSANLAPLTVL